MSALTNPGIPSGPTPPVLIISCSDCVMRDSEACADCVVSFLCDRDPGDAVVIDADEARAVRLLNGAGLTPWLRHQARAG